MAKTIFGDNEDAKRGKGTTSFKPSDYILPKSKKHALWDHSERHSTNIETLAQSIVRFGLIEPIVVNPESDEPVVAEGRRRIYAGLMIEKWIATNDPRAGGLTEIRFECVVKKGTDAELMGIMIAANEHRIDNTLRTRVMQAIRMENAGASIADIMIAFGKDQPTIKKWIKLGNMSDRIQEAVFDGVLALDGAMLIEQRKLSREEQDAALERAMAEAPQPTPDAPGRTIADPVDDERSAVDDDTGVRPDAPAPNGNGKKRRATTNSVRRTLDPDAIIKPTPTQWKRLIKLLEKDKKLKRTERHFDWSDEQIDLGIAFAKIVRGEIAAKRVKGLVAVFDGRVAAED